MRSCPGHPRWNNRLGEDYKGNARLALAKDMPDWKRLEEDDTVENLHESLELTKHNTNTESFPHNRFKNISEYWDKEWEHSVSDATNGATQQPNAPQK